MSSFRPSKDIKTATQYVAVLSAAALALAFLWPGLARNFLATGIDGMSFMPHGMCYLWEPALLILHVSTDLFIALSYFVISYLLVYIIYRSRRDIPFSWVFLSFGLFIFSCGTTHLMSVWTVWHPTYWFAGYLKLVTAVDSVATAAIVPFLVPKVLNLVETAKLSEQRKGELQTVNSELSNLTTLLQRTNARLQSILDKAPAGAIISVGNVVQFANPRAERLLNLKVGTDPHGIYAETFDREKMVDSVKTSGYYEVDDVKMYGANGEIRDIWATYLPFEFDGKTAILSWLTDISSIKVAEAELRRAHQEEQAVFNAATVGIILTRNREIVRCNRTMEVLFGYEPNELVGKTTRVLYPDDETSNEIIGRLFSDLRSQGFFREERRLIRKDGTLLWIRLSAQPLDPDDFDKGLAGTFEDITAEREAMENLANARAQAEQAAEVKANFLANMSHEIRTPMNAVIGMTHLALKADPSPRITDYLKKIEASSHHLLGVINDILDFSKIEAGRMSIENIDFNLGQVVEDAVSLVIDKAAEKGLEVIVDVAEDIPRQLVGDPLRVGQILINYLNNAVKFTKKGEIVVGVAMISQAGNDATLHFSVRDSGIGISEEQRQNLFQSFQQVDASTTRKYGGTGLGLVIAKRLAEAMGGDVGVESSPGQGSTFWFTATFIKARNQPRRRELATELKGRRALVVDDNEQAQQVEDEMLRTLGLVVKSATTGQEALNEITRAAAAGTPYDLIFLDWKMPEMDGVAVAEMIHRMPLQHTPIILMVTAYDRDELLKATADKGVSTVLSKPVTPITLSNAITRVFGSHAGSDAALLSPIETNTAECDILSGGRALLVEDNDINQQVGLELLKELGLSADIAENGAVALDMARKNNYDIILMDVQMPIMDGLTATMELRKDPSFKDLPILAMTAGALASDREKCLAAGMNDYITKPIDPVALRSKVVRWLTPETAKVTKTLSQSLVNSTINDLLTLPAVDGLDLKIGLSRVMGNMTLYVSLLHKFIDGQKHTPERIGRALANGEQELGERLVHTLKGVAGNIGAVDIQAASAKLEESINKRRPDVEVAKDLAELREELSSLVVSLERALQSQPPVNLPAINREKVEEACALLSTRLADSDPQALDVLQEHSTLLRTAFPWRYAALEKSIQRFDFDAALDVLKKSRDEFDKEESRA